MKIRTCACASFLAFTTGCGIIAAHLVGNPHERIHPDTPELILKIRHTSGETNQEIKPEIVLVSLSRGFGMIISHVDTPGVFSVLASTLAEGPIVRIPYYIPERGEDPSLYRYYIVVTQFVKDSFESQLYKIRDSALDDGWNQVPIAEDGSVELIVAYVRSNPLLLSDEARLQKKLRSLGDDMDVLKPKERARLAGWGLARIEELLAKGIRNEELTKMKHKWSAIKSSGEE